MKPLLLDKMLLHSFQGLLENSSVTFGNRTFPKKGWVVFTCGIPASGKSHVIYNQFLMNAKVLDSDNFKLLYVKWLKIKIADPNVSDEIKKDLLEPFGGHIPDLNDEDDTNNLHNYISHKRHMFSRFLKAFITARAKNLENFIIDTTGNHLAELLNNAKKFKDMGYKISMIWVVADIKMAKIRNRTRDRKVPEWYMDEVYKSLLKNIPNAILNNTLIDIEEFWIVFNHGRNNLDANFRGRYKDTCYKLKKIDGKFTLDKDLLDRIIKESGTLTLVDDEGVETVYE